MTENPIPPYILEMAKEDPTYIAWWTAKEAHIEKHYTDNDHTDKYLVTLEVEVEFSRENDGVLNAHDALMWMKTGEVDFMACPYRVTGAAKVRQ